MGNGDTKDRILAAAEKLFADNGFSATSMRAITAEAEVNLAAVNYHFGSKEALLGAVFARRLGPLNQRRLELLDRAEADSHGGTSLESILEAFVGPAIRMGLDPDSGGASFMRLLGRTLAEPSEQVGRIFFAQFREVARRFSAAIHHTLPELPNVELGWRFLFMVGSMAHAMVHAHRVPDPFRELFEGADVQDITDQLIPFLAAGFRAAVPAERAEGSS